MVTYTEHTDGIVYGEHMGDTQVFDETTGKYEVMLSDDDGNLLEFRDDIYGNKKLYYGIEAPADLSNIYVDSIGGDDANAGFKSTPLATFKEATNRLRENNLLNKSSTIWLKCGGDYYIEEDVHVLGGAQRKIRAWGGDLTVDGAAYKEIRQAGYFVNPWALEYDRPRLHVAWKKTVYNNVDYQMVSRIIMENNASVLLEGITLVFDYASHNTARYPVHVLRHGHAIFTGNGNVNLTGVVVDDTDDIAKDQLHLAVFDQDDNSSITFMAVKWLSDEKYRKEANEPAIYLVETVGKFLVRDYKYSTSAVIDGWSVTPLEPNMKTVIATDNFIAPIIRDKSGTVINVNCNVVL